MSQELPILTELREALVRLLDGDPFAWQRIGGSYDLLRRALVEAVRGDHGEDAGPLVDECWSLLRRPEALEQVARFHRLDPHYAGVNVDSAWLYGNACGLVATARAAVAAQRHDVEALLTWSRRAGELLGRAGDAPATNLDLPPAPASVLVNAAFCCLTEHGWRVQGARLWTLAWLPADEAPHSASRRSRLGRRVEAAMPDGPTVRVPVAGCFDGNGFLADLCLRQLEGEGELLPHPETALQPLGSQLLGGLEAAWEPYGQSVCFTFGLHDANVPSWVPLEGTSLSGAAALGFELLRHGKAGDACRLVIAHVGPEGSLEAVGHEVEKMEAALDGDVRSVVLPHDSQVPEVSIERFRQSGLEVLRARTLQEVLDLPPVKQPSPPERRSRWAIPVIAAAALLLGAFGVQMAADRRRCPASENVEIVAAGVWSDNEEDAFQDVLEAFCEKTGIKVEYTRTPNDEDMDQYIRINQCDPPDVVMLAQPGLLEELVQQEMVQPLEQEAVENIKQHYTQSAQTVGKVNGIPYGVYFKATNKSLWWYNTDAFRKAGIEPPATLDEMMETADRFEALTDIPWAAIGGKDGWLLTDLFENIYLRTAGSKKYDALAGGKLPWTDQSVIDALNILKQVLDDGNVAGGAAGALATDWRTAALQMVLSGPTGVGTTFGGDFVQGYISSQTKADPEADFDSFPFPSINGSPPAVVGGGDIAVALTKKPQAQKLLAFLATPEAASVWARQSGFISPNRNVPRSTYPDEPTRRSAEALKSTDTFRFDLSDQLPPAFGAKHDKGMWVRFQEFLKSPDPQRTAEALQADAEQARAPRTPPTCSS